MISLRQKKFIIKLLEDKIKHAGKTLYKKNSILKIVFYSINGLVTTRDAKPLIQSSSNSQKRSKIFIPNQIGPEIWLHLRKTQLG